MWKLATLGSGLLIAGALEFIAQLSRTPTLGDYLAFRCGPSEQAQFAGFSGHALLSAAHCWGCYAMVIGAGLLGVAALQRMNRHPAGMRAPD